MNLETQKVLEKANALRDSDNYPEALVEYAKAFMLDPYSTEISENIQFLWERIQDGHYDLIPDCAEHYLLRGISRFYKQEFVEAAEDYNKAIELDNNLDYAYKSRGYLFFYVGMYEKAKIDFAKAIALDKNRGEYWDDAATNFVQLGDILQAHLCHETAISVSSDDPRLWYNYGVFLAEHYNDALEALKKFDMAIKLFPNYEDAILNRNALIEYLSGQK